MAGQLETDSSRYHHRVPTPEPPATTALATAMALAVALQLLVTARTAPPPVRPRDATPGSFSAERARGRLARVLGDPALPHPVGSRANDMVRERLVNELRALGYETELQSEVGCAPHGVCAPIVNVIASTGSGPDAIMLACHYDSVPAGPGAADDGAGVAALLEIATILRARPPLPRPIIFFAGDGEEAGLLGARAFVAHHRLARTVRTVVNLEARGTSGVAALFETSDDNGALIDLAAAVLARPVTSSALYGLYELLPNDTDLTVFKAAGMDGLNFAFADDLPSYHTERDTLARLDLGSLQHLGDQALACVTALAAAAPQTRRGPAVFFDVLGLFIVRWPARVALPMASAATLLVALGIVALGRGRLLSLRQLVAGAGAFVASTLAALGLGLLLSLLVSLARGVPDPWLACPTAIGVASVALATAAMLAPAVAVAPAFGWGLWSGAAATWAVLALLSAWLWPASSYLALVPAALHGVALMLAARLRSRAVVWLLLPVLAGTALVWLPLGRALWVMVGPQLNPTITLPAAIVAGVLTPIAARPGCLGRTRIAGAALLLAIAATAVALVVPTSSTDSPRHVNILLLQRQKPFAAHWLVRAAGGARPPAALLATGAFSPRDIPVYPWDDPAARPWASPADTLPLPFPELRIETDEPTATGHRLLAHLTSTRGATMAIIAYPANAPLAVTRLGGVTVEPNSPRARHHHPGWSAYAIRGLPVAGIDVTIELRGDAPVEVTVLDQSFDLPVGGDALRAARPPSAVAVQDGDATLLVRRLAVGPVP